MGNPRPPPFQGRTALETDTTPHPRRRGNAAPVGGRCSTPEPKTRGSRRRSAAAERWRAAYEATFPPKAAKKEAQDLSLVDAEQFAEETIDVLRRQKQAALEKMRNPDPDPDPVPDPNLSPKQDELEMMRNPNPN